MKSMVEWNLPPVRFQSLGTSGFYIPWLRPSIFIGGLATNVDDRRSRRILSDAGAQVDWSISALSALDLTLSMGGAVSFESNKTPRYEAMISLKVLR
jgi:hypothetical protein